MAKVERINFAKALVKPPLLSPQQVAKIRIEQDLGTGRREKEYAGFGQIKLALRLAKMWRKQRHRQVIVFVWYDENEGKKDKFVEIIARVNMNAYEKIFVDLEGYGPNLL